MSVRREAWENESDGGVDEEAEEIAESEGSILRQPRAVWAVAFACVVSFMGLGLVDPILPAIADQLHATPSQVELLFTSYFLITGLTMVITGVVSSRIGPRMTLLGGLALIVTFSALAGLSDTISGIVGFRAGWGLGNALFIATALAVIVQLSTGGTERAVILYEAALGLGISAGPLLGGLLGSVSWRGPFFGVAVLMTIGFVAILTFLPPMQKPQRRESLMDPIRALKYRGLLTLCVTALFYNFGFFTLLAYTPLTLGMDALGLGMVFFGWGVMLAITSVFVAPRVQARLGTLPTMGLMIGLLAADLLVMGFAINSHLVLISCVIIGGAFLGINNTLITTAAMQAAPVERPVASAAYSFVRFVGGGSSPFVAGLLAENFNAQLPFFAGTVMLLIAILCLFTGRAYLQKL